MCGLAGELRRDGPADTSAVARMAARMADRGPDGVGAWSSNGAALGHRRLSIIDLSPHGAQPMVDPVLGRAVAFNGCIYNHSELRAELERDGYAFFSTSDTEVLIKAHHRWGDRFVERLHGMFAFCIVERDSGRALLGRDRLGIKPLYLADVGDRNGAALRFASTVPALLAGGDIDTSIDPVALHQYLSWHAVVAPPRTILNGVRKLAPATLLAIEPDGTRTEARYWEPSFRATEEQATWGPQEWTQAVRDAMGLAVRRRMVADVDVGVLLSGGLDSSLIVALLAEQGQTGLRTFSIGFDEADEFAYSDLVAEHFGTRHTQLHIETGRVAGAVRRAIGAMSEPMVSHDATAFLLLSEEVAKHVKVVQSGQGADEVFAGYHWYPPMADAEGHEGLQAYEDAFFDRTDADIAALVSPDLHVAGAPSRTFVHEHFARPGVSSPLDRALRLDQEVMLPEDPIKRVDNMTMSSGLEGRVPFLDHDLVELAAACPPALKLAEAGKGVLKAAARGLVPDAVIDRPKGYFPVPALVELQGAELELVRDAMAAPQARARGLFRPERIEQLLAEPNEHRTPSGANELWQVAVLEQWLQAHVDAHS